MKINLQIDRIILHDLALGRQEQEQLQAALQSELQRLLSIPGAASAMQQDKNVRASAPQAVTLGDTGDAEHLGNQVAQGIYRGVSG